MTIPNDIPSELIHRLSQEAHQKHRNRYETRTDLPSLWIATRGDIDKVDPVALFWNLHRPQLITSSETSGIEISSAPRLSEEIEILVLDCLEHLQNRCKARYELDESDSELKEYFNELGNLSPTASYEVSPIPRKLMQFIVYLHVVGARALKMIELQGDGLSEEILTCLNEAKGTIDRLERIGMNETSIRRQSFQISSWAVSARVLMELGRARRSDSDSPDALRYFAMAADFQDHVHSALDSGLVEYDRGSGTPNKLSLSFPLDLRMLWVEEGVGDISPQDVVSTFLLVKKAGGEENWQQIRQCCQSLAECEVMFRQYVPDVDKFVTVHVDEVGDPDPTTGSITALVQDEEGREVTWDQFWYAAEAWIDSQLSPSEYRRMREFDKSQESEERLKSYFFDDDWRFLPEQSQKRLINADRTWCSRELGSLEAILNDLRIAVEAACREFVWRPLESTTKGGANLLEFLKLKHRLEANRKEPGIRDYIRVCESRYYEELLEGRKFNRKDTQFLTEDLPAVMRRLADERNLAEHEHEFPWSRNEVALFFQAFLGIGRSGVLPELARIGRKLCAEQHP